MRDLVGFISFFSLARRVFTWESVSSAFFPFYHREKKAILRKHFVAIIFFLFQRLPPCAEMIPRFGFSWACWVFDCELHGRGRVAGWEIFCVEERRKKKGKITSEKKKKKEKKERDMCKGEKILEGAKKKKKIVDK